MFFLNVQNFLRPSSFWKKKNWQLLFENAIKKKKRGGNLNYKTHPVVLFSSVSVTKKKERSRTKTIFKASNDPVSKVKVWILTQIEGRIQENVRIFFLTSDRFDRWLNMYSFFLPPMLICRHKNILWENWIFFFISNDEFQ